MQTGINVNVGLGSVLKRVIIEFNTSLSKCYTVHSAGNNQAKVNKDVDFEWVINSACVINSHSFLLLKLMFKQKPVKLYNKFLCDLNINIFGLILNDLPGNRFMGILDIKNES